MGFKKPLINSYDVEVSVSGGGKRVSKRDGGKQRKLRPSERDRLEDIARAAKFEAQVGSFIDDSARAKDRAKGRAMRRSQKYTDFSSDDSDSSVDCEPVEDAQFSPASESKGVSPFSAQSTTEKVVILASEEEEEYVSVKNAKQERRRRKQLSSDKLNDLSATIACERPFEASSKGDFPSMPLSGPRLSLGIHIKDSSLECDSVENKFCEGEFTEGDDKCGLYPDEDRGDLARGEDSAPSGRACGNGDDEASMATDLARSVRGASALVATVASSVKALAPRTPRAKSVTIDASLSPFPQALPEGALSSPRARSPRSSSGYSPHLSSPSVNSPRQNLFSTPSQSRDEFDGVSLAPTVSSRETPVPELVAHSIFEALFGGPTSHSALSAGLACKPPRMWDDADDSEEDDDEDVNGSVEGVPVITPVDETWFKKMLSTSLLTSAAIDYACKKPSVATFSQPPSPGTARNVAVSPHNSSKGKDNYMSSCTSPVGEGAGAGAGAGTSSGVGENILSTYISPRLIHTLVAELAFEDTRFQSPRVSVLKAIYRNSPACAGHTAPSTPNPCGREDVHDSGPARQDLRRAIVTAICVAATARAERCRGALSCARSLEIEVNWVAAKGMLGGLYEANVPPGESGLASSPTGNSAVMAAMAGAVDSTAGLPGHWGGGEERRCTQIRDNVAPILELLRYVASLELSETRARAAAREELMYQRHRLAYEDVQSQYSPSTTAALAAMGTTEATALDRLHIAHRGLVTILRCYGCGLGLSGESAEQPAVLEGLLTCLKELLMAAASMPRACPGACKASPTTALISTANSIHCNSGTKIAAVEEALEDQGGDEGEGGPCHEVAITAASWAPWLAEEVAGSLLRAWPSPAAPTHNTGRVGAQSQSLVFGHSQEVAFLKVAEVAVSFGLPASLSSLATESCAGEQTNRDGSAAASTVAGSSPSSPVLVVPLARGAVDKCVGKLVTAIRSSHFKVALQALAAINSPAILGRYFTAVDAANSLHVLMAYLAALPLHPPQLPSLSNISGMAKTAMMRRFDGVEMSLQLMSSPHFQALRAQSFMQAHAFLNRRQQEALEALVEALRANRGHWHPQVQQQSACLFDWLLEHLDED